MSNIDEKWEEFNIIKFIYIRNRVILFLQSDILEFNINFKKMCVCVCGFTNYFSKN